MDFVQASWLAVIQGITEFLPISSSGHLALVPWLFGWEDQGLAFDVAVHVGTLLAVVLYFRRDISLILSAWWRSLTGGPVTVHSKLAWSIAFATVFVGIAGIFLEPIVSTRFRNPVPVALATIAFGVLLGVADHFGKRTRKLDQIGWKDVIVIGGAQVLALFPGTSRSGITITAGLAMGLTREASTRFSFLMAIPVISLAGVWQANKLGVADHQVEWIPFLAGMIVSATMALLCIHYFLRYVRRFSLLPFVVYRLVLGVILLAVFL